jgi:hypothetical protein
VVLTCFVVPALASDSGYHEVYRPDGMGNWYFDVQRYAELYGDASEQNQYRWESNPVATICSPPYYVPEPEDPERKVIENEAVLYPWIEIHITDKRLHWDIFKPYTFMGKAFQLYLQSNSPIQVLFGCGTITVPVGFDEALNEIIWDDYTEDQCITDKLRIKSILGKGTNDAGTPPDEIEEFIWWDPNPYYPLCPNAHIITAAELAAIPPWGSPDWIHGPDLNGMIWYIPDTVDLHYGQCWQFYEVVNVEPCDSEGKYYKEIVLTFAPDP